MIDVRALVEKSSSKCFVCRATGLKPLRSWCRIEQLMSSLNINSVQKFRTVYTNIVDARTCSGRIDAYLGKELVSGTSNESGR